MKEVAWMSALGAVSTLIVVFICLVCSAIDKPNQVNVHHDTVIWPQFPIALSTISFSFGGNVVYPHVEASMKRPKAWPKVVAAGLSTCAAMYFVTGLFGYLIYGDRVENPIYNSIPDGAARSVALVIITLHVLTAAPILVTSFALDVEEMLNISVERFGKVKEFLFRAAVRILTITAVGVIACVVPHFSELMSLIGAFANCVLIFVFPVVFYLKLTGIKNKSIVELTWCFLIILLGIVGLIFGTMEAIKELIAAFST